jgi:hypothetical protein
MIIKLSNLDSEIYKQIPLSIRLNKDEVILEDLPLEVQYIIHKDIFESEQNIYTPSNIFDAKCEISPYNDFTVLETKRSTIIEYIKNYLSVERGTYPFDPEFGNTLKTHLQTKDTYLRKKLVGAELYNMTEVINNSFRSDITIEKSTVVTYNTNVNVEYGLELRIKIENEITIFNLT